MNYAKQYDKYLNLFNAELDKCILSIKDKPSILKEAMVYAISGGGKRIRPVLCYAVAEILGLDCSSVNEFAVAIELIHSYSLVHDDLPAMDNDDYRRGKLSTHKKFGEAYGILAGDALLNYAHEYCLSKKDFSIKDAKALRLLSEYAGYSGMIAGQVYDMQYEKKAIINEAQLYEVYNKTYKLITAPLLIASILADNKYYEELKEFGFHLGSMFQIVDDIMDVEGDLALIGKTPHKDIEVDKLTSIKVFGLDGARKRAEYHYNSGKMILNKIQNSGFLSAFNDAMYIRKK